MPLAADLSSAVQPGIWVLVIIVVLLGIAVLVAKREQDRKAKIDADLPAGAWSATCLDAAMPGTKRLLIVTDDELAIAETRTGSRDSWPWAEVTGVEIKNLRVRLQSYPGVRIELAGGPARELLVYIGDGKPSYQTGATAAYERITAHLQRSTPQQ